MLAKLEEINVGTYRQGNSLISNYKCFIAAKCPRLSIKIPCDQGIQLLIIVVFPSLENCILRQLKFCLDIDFDPLFFSNLSPTFLSCSVLQINEVWKGIHQHKVCD